MIITLRIPRQEVTWYSAFEDQPSNDRAVLCARVHIHQHVFTGTYHGDGRWYHFDGSEMIPPTHWAEMPKGPS